MPKRFQILPLNAKSPSSRFTPNNTEQFSLVFPCESKSQSNLCSSLKLNFKYLKKNTAFPTLASRDSSKLKILKNSSPNLIQLPHYPQPLPPASYLLPADPVADQLQHRKSPAFPLRKIPVPLLLPLLPGRGIMTNPSASPSVRPSAAQSTCACRGRPSPPASRPR